MFSMVSNFSVALLSVTFAIYYEGVYGVDSHITGYEGEAVTMQCPSASFTVHSAVWYLPADSGVAVASWTSPGQPTYNESLANGRATMTTPTGHLTIHSPLMSDDGRYQCILTDVTLFHTSKESKVLHIYVKPTNLQITGLSGLVTEGVSTSVQCTIGRILLPPTAPYDVYFKQGDAAQYKVTSVQISNNTNDSTKSVTASASVQLDKSDNGKPFQCIVRDRGGGAVLGSTSVTMQVAYLPDRATAVGSPVTVTEGQTPGPMLRCEFVDKGNPEAASFEWILPGQTNAASTGLTYQITPVSITSAGTYQCRPYNSVGRGQAASIILVVHATSYINTGPQNITVNESDVPVQLRCEARGKPVPSITWRFNSQLVSTQLYTVQNTSQINSETQYDKVSSTLTLAGPGRIGNTVNRIDQGYYTCGANNSVGNTAEKTAYVDVQYRAELNPDKTTNREVAMDINTDAVLTLYVTANPAATEYTWSKQNGSLPTKSRRETNIERQEGTLRIPVLADSDYGTYICAVLNAAGVSQFVFVLERRGKPDPPSDLKLLRSSAISITLQWTSNKSGGYSQTFNVFYKVAGSDWQTITDIPDPGYKQNAIAKVENLQEKTEYIFKVESTNSAGSGGFSSEFRGTTKDKPVITQSKITVIVTGNVATVKWSLPKGNFTSYGIKYCVQGTTQCDTHNITNVTTTSADITLPDGAQYEFYLIVYQGDDDVFTSLPVKAPTNGDNFPVVAVAVPVIVILLTVIGAVAFLYIRRRRQGDKKGADMELSGDRSLVVGHDYMGSNGGVSNPALEGGDMEDINPYAESPHPSAANGRPPIAAKPSKTAGAAGVEGLYAQPDKKKKQEKRGAEAAAYVPEAGNKEQDPGALYAKPEKKKKKKGKEKDEELTTLYAQPDKGKKKKKKAEAKPAYDEDENPYQNVENKNDPGENPYANVESGGQVVEEKVEDPKDSAKNIGPDGTVYADLTFTKPKGKNQKDEVIRTEEATEYATIDFKRKAPPT